MADHNKPVLTSTYANFVSELDARFDDLSVGLDPAVTSATNLPINSIRWNSALAKDQKWSGSTWVDKSGFYALGSVRFNNGTVGAPSITFNDDTTTGIFKPTATSLAVSTMGVEALRLTNGNVLIGTITDGPARLNVVNGTAPNTVTAYLATGNSDPNFRLGFRNGAGSTINSEHAALSFDYGGSRIGGIGFHRGSAADSGHITFSNYLNNERARISADGNLLLGTTADNGSKLQVVGGSTYLGGLLTADARLIASGAAGNDYNQGAVEIYGGGTSLPSALPSIGFTNPGVFAGSLRQENATDFGFYQQGGTALADLKINSITANNIIGAEFGFTTPTVKSNTRNPIWRFGNALDFGISYFQGASSYDGVGYDSIGVHFGNVEGGAPTGSSSHVTFTRNGVFAKRFGGLADASKVLRIVDAELDGNPATDRYIAHITPNAFPSELRADFTYATVTGTGGTYAGVMTFAPYDGTTASTGGPSYQLAFGSSANNGGAPQLRIRNGIDSTWNSWVDVMTPAGAVMHFATSTAPSGYLKANGAAVSRTAYKVLFDAIGTTFGAGDGSTTFNLPDLRGEFIRGWDDGRGVDTGRGFGSSQAGSVESHAHLTDGTLGGDRTVVWNRGADGTFDASSGVATGNDADYRIDSKTGTYGSTETRPRNIALLACIKF